MKLTNQQIRHFRDCGYLRLTDVIPADLTARVADMVRRESEAHAATNDTPSRPDDLKIYRLYERNRVLMHELVAHPNLVESLRGLLGPNVLYVLNRHNQAAVNATGETWPRLHRDTLQWTRSLVTAVVYLEESTIYSGCTHIIPASHLLPSMGAPQPDGGGTWMDEHPELADVMGQALPVPMPPGGVLLFDSLVFHSVGVNTSNSTRMSVVLGYRSADELDAHPDEDRQITVCGTHLYRGNDRVPL